MGAGARGDEDVGRLRAINAHYADIDHNALEWLFERLTGDPSPDDNTPIDAP